MMLDVPVMRLLEIWKRNPIATPRWAKVKFDDNGGFNFDKPDSINAIVFVALDEFGDVVDLVAWSHAAGKLATYEGLAGMVGAEKLFRPRMKEALICHFDPLAWLCSTCDGVLVVDVKQAAPLLRRAEPLEVSTPARARELRGAMAIRDPRIVVADRQPAPMLQEAA
jgi:hypothetical protein